MGRLESEIAIIAETVALHACILSPHRDATHAAMQRDACTLGHERFKVLAEQVDRRIRLARPFMQETIASQCPSVLMANGHFTRVPRF